MFHENNMGEKNNLLNRLKKIAKEQGEVMLVDENTGDLFTLKYVEEDSCCNNECDCGSVNMSTANKSTEQVKNINNFDEIELMKKVNEDIAKWRAEEKNVLGDNLKLENEEMEEVTPDNLMEEERYYLEPLE